jgi:biotin carboxyl carrier protein
VRFATTIGTQIELVEVSGGNGQYRVTIADQVWEVDARLTAQGICSLLIDGASYVADVKEEGGRFIVEVGGETYTVRAEEETRHIIRTRGGAATGDRGQTITAPMPGKVTQVAVRAGDTVDAGSPLLVIEAMKMENEFRASASGTIKDVRVRAGQAVNAGDVLVVIE